MTADQKPGESLRECPFCGSVAEVHFYKYEPSPNQVVGDDDSWSVRCTNRKCEAQPFNSRYDRQEAVDDWNRRAERNAGEGWVSVEERMPDDSQWVAVYLPKSGWVGAKQFGARGIAADGTRGTWDGSGPWNERPTHWAPLPQPPTTAARREG